MSVDVTDLVLGPLPALDTKRLERAERAVVKRRLGRHRDPDKRLRAAARLAVDAEDEATRHRGRRNDLLGWLRWLGNQQGTRNLRFDDAMGVFFTRPSYIVNNLWRVPGAKPFVARPGWPDGWRPDWDTPPPVDPGDDPVGEFLDLCERVWRAERRRDLAVDARNDCIVELHEAGLSRAGIHELAGKVFDPSLISQIVTRARKANADSE